jgi:hypothetical protein
MLKLIYMKKVIAIIVLIVVCLAFYLLLPQKISPNKIEDNPNTDQQSGI